MSLARRHVGEKLLHELVVVVGELLQHVEARFLLALEDGRREIDDLGWRVLAIDERALEGEIDEAGRRAVLPDRDLSEHERLGGGGLQDGDDLTDVGGEGVDLVQKQEVGDAAVLELLQEHLEGGDALGVGLGDDDGGVAGGESQSALVLKFDRAGAIDEGEAVAQKIHVGDIEADAHAVIAGFGRGVADGRLVGDGALARDGAGAGEDGFEKGGLARKIRADECDAAGAAARLLTA